MRLLEPHGDRGPHTLRLSNLRGHASDNGCASRTASYREGGGVWGVLDLDGVWEWGGCLGGLLGEEEGSRDERR